MKGEFVGELEFFDDKIRISEMIFTFEEIKTIEIVAKDFEGDVNVSEKGFNPMKSRGVNNSLKLNLSNGNNITVNFLQKTEDALIKNKELLLSYYKKDKISFLELMKLLKIENYSDIQAFKLKHHH